VTLQSSAKLARLELPAPVAHHTDAPRRSSVITEAAGLRLVRGRPRFPRGRPRAPRLEGDLYEVSALSRVAARYEVSSAATVRPPCHSRPGLP
jgi:hypothetical protein